MLGLDLGLDEQLAVDCGAGSNVKYDSFRTMASLRGNARPEGITGI